MVTFHVIKMHTSKDSFPMLLGRPWLRMANAVVDWRGIKPSITYGPENNRVKVPIGSSASVEVERGLILGSEEEKEGKLVENAQSGKGETLMGTWRLGSLGPSLYHWVDDGQYARWLHEHPNSVADAMMISYQNLRASMRRERARRRCIL